MLTLAKLAHLALYGFLILTPLLGWLLLSAGANPFPSSAWRSRPHRPDDGLKGTIKELHETLANVGYALIALHAAAAIYHHHVLRTTANAARPNSRRRVPQQKPNKTNRIAPDGSLISSPPGSRWPGAFFYERRCPLPPWRTQITSHEVYQTAIPS